MKVQKEWLYKLELSSYEYLKILGIFGTLVQKGEFKIETEKDKEEVKKLFESLKE